MTSSQADLAKTRSSPQFTHIPWALPLSQQWAGFFLSIALFIRDFAGSVVKRLSYESRGATGQHYAKSAVNIWTVFPLR